MNGYTTHELQEEFLKMIRTGQETAVEAVRTWVESVKAVTPTVPSVRLPLAGRLPTPQDVVAGAYDFAEKLLASQRQFAEELVKTTAPLMAGNGDGNDAGQEPSEAAA
jgi:hypothetical protein